MLFEDSYQPGEVEQGPAEAVHFIDDYGINLPRLNVLHQRMQRGSFQIGSGVTAVVITSLQSHPAHIPLARNIGLGGLPLRVQRVEWLRQAFVGRLASV